MLQFNLGHRKWSTTVSKRQSMPCRHSRIASSVTHRCSGPLTLSAYGSIPQTQFDAVDINDENQPFSPSLVVYFEPSIQALGVRAGEDLPRRRFIAEYAELEVTAAFAAETENYSVSVCYTFGAGLGRGIDALGQGNTARLLNHRCHHANCKAWCVGGRVFIRLG